MSLNKHLRKMNLETKLSENLTLREVLRSNTAKRLNIDNTPTVEELGNLHLTAKHVFQPLRNHFSAPIHVSSGYRSKALNKAVRGAKKSQHLKGQALDLDADYYDAFSWRLGRVLTNADIFHYIKNNLEFDKLIWEFGDNNNPAWVHVSYNKDGSSKMVLKAIKRDGKTEYLEI